MSKKNKRRAFQIFIAVFSLALVFLIVYPLIGQESNQENSFIVRDGSRLVIKGTGKRFRFLGGNHFNLLVKYLWGEFHGLTGSEVFEISSEHNITVIRFWATCSDGYWSDQCLYSSEKSWNNSKEEFFEGFDNLLDDAEEHGIYVIPVLCDSFSTFKLVGDGSEVCQVGSKANLEYKRFVEDVVTRYANRTAILMWEIGNEGQRYCSNTDDLINWHKDTAAFIKNLDKNHLVSTGEDNFGNLYTDMFKTINSDDNIDITSVHIYDDDLYRVVWGDMTDEEKIKYFISYWTNISHNELDKPIYFGEFGPDSISNSPDFYGKFLEDSFNSNSDGAIVWSWLEGDDCLQPLSQRSHCINPTGTPSIADEVKFWAEKFQK